MDGFFAVGVTWFITFLLADPDSRFAIGWRVLLSATLAFGGPYLWMTEHIGDALSDRDNWLLELFSPSIFAAMLVGLFWARTGTLRK
jgi:hypothetical protein